MSLAEAAAELARWLVLWALLIAAGAKAFGFSAFRQSIVESFPKLAAHAGLCAASIILLEGGIGLAMLVGGGGLRSASLSAALLFTGFTGVIGLSLVRGEHLVCTCFGAGGRQVGIADLVRGALFASAAAWAWLASPQDGQAGLARVLLAGLGVALVLPTVWMRESLWLLRARAGE